MLQQDGEKDHIFVCAHLSNHNRLYIKQGILTNHILCIKKPCRGVVFTCRVTFVMMFRKVEISLRRYDLFRSLAEWLLLSVECGTCNVS